MESCCSTPLHKYSSVFDPMEEDYTEEYKEFVAGLSIEMDSKVILERMELEKKIKTYRKNRIGK